MDSARASAERQGTQTKKARKPERARRRTQLAAPIAVPAGMRRMIPAGGAPLPSDLQADMERRFGENFSDVRVHTGAAAAASASARGARAFAMGSDIVFNAGRFDPYSWEGRRLLGHELAHVAQQRIGACTTASGASEHEAAQAGLAAANGGAATVAIGAAPGMQCELMSDEEIARADLDTLLRRYAENEQEYQTFTYAEDYYPQLEHEHQQLSARISALKRLQKAAPALVPSSDAPPPDAEPKPLKILRIAQPWEVTGDPFQRQIDERKARENDRLLQLLAPDFRDYLAKDPEYMKSMGIYADSPEAGAIPDMPAADPNLPAPLVLDLSQLTSRAKKKVIAPPEYWSSPRGQARLKLVDDIKTLRNRIDRLLGLYADVVDSSVIIRNVIEDMGGVEPPNRQLLHDAVALLDQADKEIDDDGLEAASVNYANAGAKVREIEWYWSRYAMYLELGAENTIRGLTAIKDTSKYTLMVLSMGGGGGAMVVGAVGNVAIDATDAAGRAALGEKVDWVHFSMQAALELALAKFGGAVTSKFLGRLTKVPALAGMAESKLLPVVASVLNGAEARAALTTFNGLYKGDFTWQELIDKVFDPQGILFDIVLGGVLAKLHPNQAQKPATTPSDPPPKATPAKPAVEQPVVKADTKSAPKVSPPKSTEQATPKLPPKPTPIERGREIREQRAQQAQQGNAQQEQVLAPTGTDGVGVGSQQPRASSGGDTPGKPPTIAPRGTNRGGPTAGGGTRMRTPPPNKATPSNSQSQPPSPVQLPPGKNTPANDNSSAADPLVAVRVQGGGGRKGTYYVEGTPEYKRAAGSGSFKVMPESQARDLGFRPAGEASAPIQPRVVNGRQAESEGAGGPVDAQAGQAGKWGSRKVVGRMEKEGAFDKTIRAAQNEAEGYNELLNRGEYGLQRPHNVSTGGVDAITAQIADGKAKIFLNDFTTPGVSKGAKPTHANWLKELRDALSAGRLKLGDEKAEQALRDALKNGEVYVRVVRVSPQESGSVSVSVGTPTKLDGGASPGGAQ